MYIYKYFRDDVYFDKSIRYNELFFASNSLLNDPLDLLFNPRFWDDEEKWTVLLMTRKKDQFISFVDYLNKKVSSDFIPSINSFFRNKYLIDMFNNEEDSRKELRDIIKVYGADDPINVSGAVSYLYSLFENINKRTFCSVSFSKDPFEYLMWAHYADSFKGCVVVYETNSDSNEIELSEHISGMKPSTAHLINVEYGKFKRQADLFQILNENVFDSSLFFHKHDSWKYENEVRLVFSTPSKSDGVIFHHNTNLIKAIIFGYRSNKKFKTGVINTLKMNKCQSTDKDFYIFDSKLDNDGGISITTGSHYEQKYTKSDFFKKNILDAHQLECWKRTFTMT
ncbi:DUF2971 domain-containing protein [Yersinia kristensenii]|uniref:DUF2971 domain-containing protein n=1 Tax=Yersinia kristensenii TaxID=28152 RepID=UPI0005DE5C16|nr:DUF2971 domain-containing protein [Yersinia kristensenii]CNG50935.1 Protein of uncharacterised function (DUF2971) [Yersinia kristensenii]CNK26979.1 Protein of uncharacterised function (DUF2971) [Yersinia kristensenii]